jgi:hypothetical protein
VRWSTTVSVVHLVADEELLAGPPSGGEAVTVAGHGASDAGDATERTPSPTVT